MKQRLRTATKVSTPRDRLELSTFRLTAERSAIELTGIIHRTKGNFIPSTRPIILKRRLPVKFRNRLLRSIPTFRHISERPFPYYPITLRPLGSGRSPLYGADYQNL